MKNDMDSKIFYLVPIPNLICQYLPLICGIFKNFPFNTLNEGGNMEDNL